MVELGALHSGAAGEKHGNLEPKKPGSPALPMAEPSPYMGLNWKGPRGAALHTLGGS